MYKPTIIRQYFIEYLKATTPFFQNIYGGRINPISKKDSYPYATVFAKSQGKTEEFTSHSEREMDLLISVVVRTNQDSTLDFDEIVENAMFKIEEQMSKLVTIPSAYVPIAADNYRLFEDIVFESSQITTDNSSGNDTGSAVLSYKVTFNYEEPIVPLTLEDFDLAGSIANIQILNAGVPENV